MKQNFDIDYEAIIIRYMSHVNDSLILLMKHTAAGYKIVFLNSFFRKVFIYK